MKHVHKHTGVDNRKNRAGGKGFPEVCHLLAKSGPYVHNLQTKLGLYIPGKGEFYSDAYIAFMQKIISIRTFCVPVEDICRLFETEKKLLKLLKIDSLTHSPTWYLDACNAGPEAAERLLLTNYVIDHYIKSDAIQSNLDFGAKEKELFSGHEMGENVRRIYEVYRRQREEVMNRVQAETVVLERALDWLISIS